MASFHFRNEEINNQGGENCGKRGNSVEQMRKVPFQNKEIIVPTKFHISSKSTFQKGFRRNGKKCLRI